MFTLFLGLLLGCGDPDTCAPADDVLDFWVDADSDGFGDPTRPEPWCVARPGYAANPGDCDDTDAEIHPDAEELCDKVDNNCDGKADGRKEIEFRLYFDDVDGDGFGNPSTGVERCKQPNQMVDNGLDCSDVDADVNPGAQEVCNGRDDNCDGLVDNGPLIDFDRDGDGATECGDRDCDDNDPTRFPGNSEFVCDSIDNDCDLGTADDPDADGDGVSLCAGDCDDSDPSAWPGTPEVFCDAVDNDCNAGTPDDQDLDGDGFSVCSGDCEDTVFDVNPNGFDVCDAYDNDCDGYANQYDKDEFEPNDDPFVDPIPLIATNDTWTERWASFNSVDDPEDWYRVDTYNDPEFLLNTFNVQAEVTDVPAGVTLHLALWSFDGSSLWLEAQDVDPSDGLYTRWDAAAVGWGGGGTWYISVERVGGTSACGEEYRVWTSNSG